MFYENSVLFTQRQTYGTQQEAYTETYIYKNMIQQSREKGENIYEMILGQLVNPYEKSEIGSIFYMIF